MSEQNSADQARPVGDIAAGAGMLLNGAPRIGAAASKMLYIVTERVATAGTGAKISTLHGAARQRVTLAAIGGGPVAQGGLGMAGGVSRTAITAGVATAAASALVIAGAVYLSTRPTSQN
jgi:hypothetical protein